MIVVPCLDCSSVIRIMPLCVTENASVQEAEYLVGKDSDFWPNKFPCPSCGRMCTGMLEQEADPKALEVLRLQDLTPQEAFAAFHGLGFPDEQQCSLEAVQELLRAQPVCRIIGKTVAGTERTLVDALELQDGSRVYFGAGGAGAVVYRVTRPTSYALKLLAQEGPTP